jgi:hypothetical protein
MVCGIFTEDFPNSLLSKKVKRPKCQNGTCENPEEAIRRNKKINRKVRKELTARGAKK